MILRIVLAVLGDGSYTEEKENENSSSGSGLLCFVPRIQGGQAPGGARNGVTTKSEDAPGPRYLGFWFPVNLEEAAFPAPRSSPLFATPFLSFLVALGFQLRRV